MVRMLEDKEMLVFPDETVMGSLAKYITNASSDNFQPMIKGKNVLILNGSITTGSTLSKAIESILYYGGTIRGIAAIFSRVDSVASLPVYSIFNTKDIPDYHSYSSTKCPMCQRQQKIDAIVSSYGYSAL